MRIEFNLYDDDTFYFLYVTNEVRIETDGQEGLLIEDRNGEVQTICDPVKYLTIEQHEDKYFNESLANTHLDTLIDAVKALNHSFKRINLQ
ncbi:hypothetical protein SOM38_01410 [Pantoea agglomerans]|jgi:hypothetical protein|uniref:hypothetical protein n=1 Tax=Erwiniaceae TaxID=1903409 RepID=UPI000787B0C1|nr:MULTISPECIES: hypothetical protein [Erwiniaceae]MDY0992782.1 hypothetical protein [Pantoea agglomerans]